MPDVRLIDANALLKKIAHHTVYDSMSCVTFERSTIYEMVKGDMFGLVKDAPAIDAIPRWISVEERLPEFDVDVLVFATGDFRSVITITSYSDRLYGFNIKGWVPPWQYFHENHTITHWMPIPQPPEEPA